MLDVAPPDDGSMDLEFGSTTDALAVGGEDEDVGPSAELDVQLAASTSTAPTAQATRSRTDGLISRSLPGWPGVW